MKKSQSRSLKSEKIIQIIQIHIITELIKLIYAGTKQVSYKIGIT